MRYWEIDFLRGIGIILMLISNFVTDLQIFLNYPYNPFWYFFAIFTASIFVFTSGATFYVNYTIKRNFKRILRRFLKLMTLGFSITLITYFLFKQGTIYFGILHFLALAWILAIPFYYIKITIPLSFIFITLYFYISTVHAQTYFLLPIGITPQNFYTFDYFPIFPWFGVFLLGFEFGKFVMKRKRERRSKMICWLGRNSLKIYLIHQPIIVSILLILFGDKSGIFVVKLK